MKMSLDQLIDKLQRLRDAVPACNNVEAVDYDNTPFVIDNVVYDPGDKTTADCFVITINRN